MLALPAKMECMDTYCWCVVQVEVALFNRLSVVTLGIGQPEQSLFQEVTASVLGIEM